MKTIKYTHYGDPEVLQLGEADKPMPAANEVLVRNRAASVNYGDLIARRFNQVSLTEFNMPGVFWLLAKLSFGLNRPRNHILGSEFAGEVEAVGTEVSRFKPGDRVFGYLGQRMGGYAEYVTIAESGELEALPAGLSYEQASAVPYGAITAYSLLQKADIKPGQQVLIVGASGSIGSAATQLAKHYGAEVTAVCGTNRVEFVRSLGAEAVINYKKQDFTELGGTYDLIFDVLGSSSFSACQGLLKDEGVYLLASFKLPDLLAMLWSSLVGGKKVVCALSPEHSGNLPVIKELIESGAFKVSIDRSFPMDQASEAHRYAESDQRRGPVAIAIGISQVS